MARGFGYEFLDRPDGYPGLARTYGLASRRAATSMDLSLTYRALASGQVDLIAGDATAGLIASLDLVALEDNRHYFPPYDAVPVARASTLLRHPAGAARDRGARGSHHGRRHARDESRGGCTAGGARRDRATFS